MAPCIAEDASFLRLETEEESETYAGKEVAYPAFRGILCSEHMIHLIGREVKNGLRRHLIENAFAPDFRNELISSVELARAAGVKEEEILNTQEDIDEFFLE